VLNLIAENVINHSYLDSEIREQLDFTELELVKFKSEPDLFLPELLHMVLSSLKIADILNINLKTAYANQSLAHSPVYSQELRNMKREDFLNFHKSVLRYGNRFD
jgi:hypothetical protein